MHQPKRRPITVAFNVDNRISCGDGIVFSANNQNWVDTLAVKKLDLDQEIL